MLEVIVLISLFSAAAVAATWHARPGTRIRTSPVRMLQTLVFGHAPAFVGFFLSGLSEGLTPAVVACVGAGVYAAGYGLLSHSDAFKRWPYYMVLASLGVSIVLFFVVGVQSTPSGKAGIVLVHAALFHFLIADVALESVVT